MEMCPDFASTLSHVDLAALEASEDIAYAVDGTWRLRYTNAAWSQSASQHQETALASAIGQDVLEACTPALRPAYASLYQRAAREGAVIEHEYCCPTPAHQQRFRMQLRGLPSGSVLVTHHRISQAPHPEVDPAQQESDYRSAAGLIIQCAHCRLTRRTDRSAWDWVPAFVEAAPDRVSHGICPPCFSLYFPEVAAQRLKP